MVGDENRAYETTSESLASKSFCSSSTNDDQPQAEMSKFGFESLAAHKQQVIPEGAGPVKRYFDRPLFFSAGV
jgi:hypothetical protein